MFNPEVKERYLAEKLDKTKDNIERFFNKAEKTEELFNKDLADFNKADVKKLLEDWNSKNRYTLACEVSSFSSYYKWCYRMEYTDNAQNPYNPKRINELAREIVPDRLMNDKFFTKENLLEYLDKIEDVSNKFILYALFKGVTGEELINLKLNDLNEKEKKVQLFTGRDIKVDKYLLN